MIKAVLFDFDGTLMNTPPVIIKSWQYAAKKLLGYELPLQDVINSFGEPILTTIDRHFKGVDPDLALRTYLEYSDNELKPKDIKMFPEMRELVLGVKELGYKVGMVTTRVWGRMSHHLYDFDLEPYFDCFVSGEDCTKFKPDPEPVNIALARLGVKPEEAIMLGDTSFDIQCSHNAGIKAVMVTWSLTATLDDFAAADFVLKQPEDLYDYLNMLNESKTL